MAYRPVTVSTTVTQIASYNEKRRALVIYNNSSSTLYISNDPQDIVARGLPVGGGVAISLVASEGDEPHLALYGQMTAGTADVRVVEGFGI